MKLGVYGLFLAITITLTACVPEIAEKTELQPIPAASFEIVPNGTPNDFILRNTTPGAFVTQWDLGEAGSYKGEQVNVNILFKGEYEVKMTSAVQGGIVEAAQKITVTTDDPDACSGPIAFLTGCSEKTWVLAPEADAMHIGPNITETWWGNSVQDVSDRECHFNDEYIFRLSGEFEYNNKGDWWADEVSGTVWPNDLGLSIGCHASTEWPAKYQAWDSGVHSFSLSETQLTISGLGAWIGLYKAGTEGEVDTPQESVTYNILELTADRIVIAAEYSWGAWRFTLVPKG